MLLAASSISSLFLHGFYFCCDFIPIPYKIHVTLERECGVRNLPGGKRKQP